MKRILIVVAFLITGRVVFSQQISSVQFMDANTRETYETVHHIKASHRMATGKGLLKKGIQIESHLFQRFFSEEYI